MVHESKLKVEHLRAGVQIIGLATIAVKNQAARTAKNPRTGAVVNVPAKKVVKIKAGAKLAL